MNVRLALLATFGLALGAAAGVGAYTFIYARGAPYLTNDPNACVNCHVMREQYDGGGKSSHRAVAVCNDCHTHAEKTAKDELSCTKCHRSVGHLH